jgi:hypothetical protein
MGLVADAVAVLVLVGVLAEEQREQAGLVICLNDFGLIRQRPEAKLIIAALDDGCVCHVTGSFVWLLPSYMGGSPTSQTPNDPMWI